jgi:hypothetical protein
LEIGGKPTSKALKMVGLANIFFEKQEVYN